MTKIVPNSNLPAPQHPASPGCGAKNSPSTTSVGDINPGAWVSAAKTEAPPSATPDPSTINYRLFFLTDSAPEVSRFPGSGQPPNPFDSGVARNIVEELIDRQNKLFAGIAPLPDLLSQTTERQRDAVAWFLFSRDSYLEFDARKRNLLLSTGAHGPLHKARDPELGVSPIAEAMGNAYDRGVLDNGDLFAYFDNRGWEIGIARFAALSGSEGLKTAVYEMLLQRGHFPAAALVASDSPEKSAALGQLLVESGRQEVLFTLETFFHADDRVGFLKSAADAVPMPLKLFETAIGSMNAQEWIDRGVASFVEVAITDLDPNNPRERQQIVYVVMKALDALPQTSDDSQALETVLLGAFSKDPTLFMEAVRVDVSVDSPGGYQTLNMTSPTVRERVARFCYEVIKAYKDQDMHDMFSRSYAQVLGSLIERANLGSEDGMHLAQEIGVLAGGLQQAYAYATNEEREDIITTTERVFTAIEIAIDQVPNRKLATSVTKRAILPTIENYFASRESQLDRKWRKVSSLIEHLLGDELKPGLAEQALIYRGFALDDPALQES